MHLTHRCVMTCLRPLSRVLSAGSLPDFGGPELVSRLSRPGVEGGNAMNSPTARDPRQGSVLQPSAGTGKIDVRAPLPLLVGLAAAPP